MNLVIEYKPDANTSNRMNQIKSALKFIFRLFPKEPLYLTISNVKNVQSIINYYSDLHSRYSTKRNFLDHLKTLIKVNMIDNQLLYDKYQHVMLYVREIYTQISIQTNIDTIENHNIQSLIDSNQYFSKGMYYSLFGLTD
jgi:hypothetical protein